MPFAGAAPDTVESLSAWVARYLTLATVGVRSEEVADKIALHLQRFATFYQEAYGHERIRNVLKRDVLAWQRALSDQGLAAATVNNHLASLSGFTTWVAAQAPPLFAVGDPAKKTMNVAVHVIPTGSSGSDKPKNVNTGTGGQAVGQGPSLVVDLTS